MAATQFRLADDTDGSCLAVTKPGRSPQLAKFRVMSAVRQKRTMPWVGPLFLFPAGALFAVMVNAATNGLDFVPQ
jgi:hypothetical protein